MRGCSSCACSKGIEWGAPAVPPTAAGVARQQAASARPVYVRQEAAPTSSTSSAVIDSTACSSCGCAPAAASTSDCFTLRGRRADGRGQNVVQRRGCTPRRTHRLCCGNCALDPRRRVGLAGGRASSLRSHAAGPARPRQAGRGRHPRPATHGMLSAKLSISAPPCAASSAGASPTRASDRMHSSTRSSNVSEIKRWPGRGRAGPPPDAVSKA